MSIVSRIRDYGFITLIVYILFTYIYYLNPSFEIIVTISLYLLCAIAFIYTLVTQKITYNQYIKHYAVFTAIIMCTAVFPYVGTTYGTIVFNALLEVIKVLIFTYCVNSFVEYKRIPLLFITISFSSLILFLFTGARFDIYSGVRFGNDLAGNANIIAPLYMFAAVSSTYCIFRFRNKLLKVIFICIYIIQLYALILTGTKKSLLIAFLFFWLYFILTQKRKFALICFAAFIFIFLLFWSLIFNIQVLYDLIGYRFEGMLLAFTTGQGDESTMERMNMISDAMEFWRSHPVFGIGLNLFSEKGIYGAYSHNNYVELLATTGIAGFIAYYSYHLSFFMDIRKQLRYEKFDGIFSLLIIASMMLYDVGAVSYNLPLVQLFLSLSNKLVLKNSHTA